MRKHWSNCIAHFDEGARAFVDEYFARDDRHCLLVGAAGFDPRSRHIAELLESALSRRLTGLFIREERGLPDVDLSEAADANENALRKLISDCRVEKISVFDEVDGASVGGQRIAAILAETDIPDQVTDIVLDMSALSTGIGFPAARVLLEMCESAVDRSFHVLISSNPDIDDQISSEPADQASFVRGFAASLEGEKPRARIWLPQLTKGRDLALSQIRGAIGECYKVCPILPFPSRDPRRADSLIAEFATQIVDEWEVDPRDLIYISEHNPIDCYRTISTLKERFDRSMEGTFDPEIVLSPIGSKVLAAGAMMAAIEHNLAVSHVETLRYETVLELDSKPPSNIVHMLLSGPAYGDYNKTLMS